MALRVSGKNLDIGESLRHHAVDKVGDALQKYFDGGWSGHLTVEKDGTAFRAETNLHLTSGLSLQSEGRAHDAYGAVDRAVEHIAKRLRRYKRRITDFRAGPDVPLLSDAPSYVIEAPPAEEEEAEEGFAPVIVAESTQRLKRLSIADAVAELDLTGAPVVVFRHASHGRVNVVFRRPDGHVGWVDPPHN